MDSATGNAVPAFWQVVGIIGGAIFFGRFYVQWLDLDNSKKMFETVDILRGA